MKLRFLSRDDVRSAFTMEEAVDAMREAFGQLSGYQAEIPARTSVEGESGVLMVMAGRLSKSSAMGAKLISVFGDNAERGLPVVNAVLVMVDGATGIPLAVVEGSYLTALRTGAASGLATELLSRKGASVLTVFGAGVQARTQVEAIRTVRHIREVRIVSRTRESAESMADELEGLEVRVMEDRAEAVRGADVICTATTSREPVFPGEDVDPGTHVNGLSSLGAEAREVDDAFVSRARIVVDSVEAALEEAGDLVGPIRRNVITRADVYGELGEVVNGRLPGRTDDEQITFFKSVGNAAQDLAMGRRLMVHAAQNDLGTMLEL
ncbi:MAG: ornithine cyclodeaminase family protein [Gemmatimonadota bacterium]